MVNYMSQAVQSRRIWRALSYALFAVGSFAGVYAPSRVITETSSRHLAVAWSVIFAFSISFAIIGTLRRNMFIEYIALPAIGGSFLVYGLCLLYAAWPNDLHRIPAGFFILGITAFIAARYSELNGQINGQPDSRAEWPPTP